MSAAPEVKVLWGHTTRQMDWVIETPARGREVVASANPNRMTVRDLDGLPAMTISGIAGDVAEVWGLIRNGKDPSAYATHRLAPPLMRDIEPIPEATK